jgi:hypothetical protein
MEQYLSILGFCRSLIAVSLSRRIGRRRIRRLSGGGLSTLRKEQAGTKGVIIVDQKPFGGTFSILGRGEHDIVYTDVPMQYPLGA